MITLGHIIAAIIVIIVLTLASKYLVFLKYNFTGAPMRGVKFVAYLVKVIIIGAMLMNMYIHYLVLADFIQGLTVFTMGKANYYVGVIEIAWIVGAYFSACLLEMAIGFGLIMPYTKRIIEDFENNIW